MSADIKNDWAMLLASVDGVPDSLLIRLGNKDDSAPVLELFSRDNIASWCLIDN